jgi:D-arabinose 1-dehydrogenase-like Zn-dependent alcohol dehydrogenase
VVTPDQIAVSLGAVQAGAAAGVGVVIEAGEHAQALLGARVLVGGIDACGECDVCRRGGAPVCPSARVRTAHDFAPGETVIAAARWATPTTLLEPAAAAIPGDVALAYTLYARTGVGPREPVVVAGASPIARFLVDILRAKGIAPVVIADAPAAWAADLAAAGITAVATREAAAAEFHTRGYGARPWRVFATGIDVASAAALAGPRATLTFLAPAALPADVFAREVSVIAVAAPHPDLVVEVAALCAKGDITLATSLTPNDAALTVIAAL